MASEGLVLRDGFPWIWRSASHEGCSLGRSFRFLRQFPILLDRRH
jgi:hypothetical protein